MTRLRPRTDGNQTEVVAALRKSGASVCSLAGQADGVPDLLVGWRGKTILIEVKDSSKPPSARKLTPAQVRWHAEWTGQPVHVVNSVEDALAVLRKSK